MKERIFRTILWVIIGVIMFVLGYYNQQVQAYFLNKDALIGLLFAVGFGYFLYSQFLEKKILKNKIYHEHDRRELEEHRQKEYRRKTYHEKLDSVKAELIGRMKEQNKELYKSISLRDDIIKNVKSDLSTQISNMKHDILSEINKK